MRRLICELIDELLDPAALTDHQAQDKQEWLNVVQTPLLIPQLLLLRRLVDAGGH